MRKESGNTNIQKIAGYGGCRLGIDGIRISVKSKNAEFATDLRAAEGGGFFLCEEAKFAGTALDNTGRKVIGNAGGPGAGARGVGKDVKVSERERFDEMHGGRVIFFRFAGEAGDDIGADGGMGEKLTNQLDTSRIVFGAIPAVHGGEDAVGGGLQRHVEMWREAPVRGEKIHEVGRDVKRFDGTDAETFDSRFAEDRFQEIEKFYFGRKIVAVGAEIDTAEDDFLVAGTGEALNFGDDSIDGEAAGFSAHEGDDAERTTGIAAILDF